MPWVSSPEAALIFCTLPEGPVGHGFRAVFETASDCVLGVKDVSSDVVHCMMGVAPTGLLWRSQVRTVAKSMRRSALSNRWADIENDLYDSQSA